MNTLITDQNVSLSGVTALTSNRKNNKESRGFSASSTVAQFLYQITVIIIIIIIIIKCFFLKINKSISAVDEWDCDYVVSPYRMPQSFFVTVAAKNARFYRGFFFKIYDATYGIFVFFFFFSAKVLESVKSQLQILKCFAVMFVGK